MAAPKLDRMCEVHGCKRSHHAFGMCAPHYHQWRRRAALVPIVSRVKRDEFCTVDSCDRPHMARGLCMTHYARWRRHGDAATVMTMFDHPATCTIDGCNRPYDSKGYCSKHYGYWRRWGNPLESRHTPSSWDVKPTPPDSITAEDADAIILTLRTTRPRPPIVKSGDRRWRYGSYRPSVWCDGIALPVTPSQSIGILSDTADAA